MVVLIPELDLVSVDVVEPGLAHEVQNHAVDFLLNTEWEVRRRL